MISSRLLIKSIKRKILLVERTYAKNRNPFVKTWETLVSDIKSGFNVKPTVYPEHADIVIIGGGFIGSSAAYWLKSRAGEGLSVVVIEKDPTNLNARKMLSHGVLTQHFSLPENIQLAQFSVDFLRNIKENLNADVDIQYCPLGCLLLASDKYVQNLEQNIHMHKDHGIKNKLLTIDEIRTLYPWINTSDIKSGCIGIEAEGVFNANELHRSFIQKSQDLGANYIKAEVVKFELELQRDVLMEGIKPGSFQKLNNLIYRTEDNMEYSMKFAACVIAAGTESANVARLAKVGELDGLMKVPLPIEKREYNIYSIENVQNKITAGLNFPYIMDTSGLWLRKMGLHDKLICGQVPSINQDSGYSDHEIFQASLFNRYPHFKDAEIKVISTEQIDCNTYDDNGIIGPHVYHGNLIFASGFGRQGVPHSPGIGKAVADLIIDCQYSDIDLTRFGFDRLLTSAPLIESNVY